MPEPFFLYHEDVDLSLRVRLAGGELGVEPAARVDHDYEFEKGADKWRYLERNRWATLIRTYPAALLAAAGPGAARDRAGAGGRRRGRRLAAAEAARLGRDARLRCRGCSAERRRIQAARDDRRRRVRRRAHREPRLGLPRPGRALARARRRPRRLLGASSGAAPRSASRRPSCSAEAPFAAWHLAARPRAAPARGGPSPGRGSWSPPRAARWRPRSSTAAGTRCRRRG